MLKIRKQISVFCAAMMVLVNLMAVPACGTLVTWDGGGANGKWNTGANWDGDVAPTSADSVLFNAGSASCTLDVNGACTSLVATSGYSGNIIGTGFQWLPAQGAHFDHTGKLHLGNRYQTQTFADTQYHSSVTAANLTVSSCTLDIRGTGKIDLDGGNVNTEFPIVYCAYTSQNDTFAGANDFYTRKLVGKGGYFRQAQNMYVRGAESGYPFSYDAGTTFDGNGSQSWYMYCIAAVNCTTPKMVAPNAILVLSNPTASTASWTFSDSIKAYYIQLRKGSTGKQTYNFNNQKVLSVGYTIISNDNATDTAIINCGSSVCNVTGGYCQINSAGTGPMKFNMQTSTWTVAGNWTIGAQTTNATGTSTVTLSAASTITSNGMKTAYDMIFTGTNKKTFADAPTFDGDLTATTGHVVWSTFGFTTAGDVTIDGTDTLRMGTNLTGNGTAQTFHIGSTVTVCSTAACTIGTTSSCALTLDDDEGKTFPKLKQTNSGGTITLTGTGTSTFNNARMSGDLIINNTGKDTIQDLTCDSLTLTAGDLSFKNLDTIALYFGIDGGKVDMTGDTLRFGGDMKISVSDSFKANDGSYLTYYGTDDSLKLNNAGTIATTGMNLTSSGTGLQVRCQTKTLTIDTLKISNNSNMTYSGSTTDLLSISGATPKIILGNNSRLTTNSRVSFVHTASCTPWSFGTTDTVNGSDGFYYRANGTGLTATWPAFTHTGAAGGTVRMVVSGLSGNTINLAGNFSMANGLFTILPATAGVLNFNCAGYNIAASKFYLGSSDVGTLVFHAGSGTHTVDSTFFNTYVTSACSLYMDTATINVNQRWAMPTTHAIVMGKSTVYGTGTSSITSSTIPFYNFGVNATGTGVVTMADKFKVGGWFKVLDGKMTITNHADKDTVVGVATLTGDTLDASGDTLYFSDTLKATAATFIGVGDANTRWIVDADPKHITLAGAKFPACTLVDGGSINGGGTLARLLLNRAGGDSVTFEAGKKFIITQVDSTDWSAPTTNKHRIHSSIDDTACSSRDSLKFTSGTVGFKGLSLRNNGFMDDVQCDSCESDGGNYLCP